ncbi:MAG: metal ABC transporter permease [Firmicutes bacterium]|nr:metal ABC transporter permease [Bacillota bacterium]
MPEFLQYDFMIRALVSGLIVGVICPVIGIFIVLKRLSMIGDCLSHAAMAGVAAGMLTGVYPVYGALAFMIAAGLTVERLRNEYRQYSELAIAVILSSSISLAIILLSVGKSYNTSVFAYLFGSILTVSGQDLKAITGLGLLVILVVWLLRKELFYIAFDEEAAHLAGIPVAMINIVFILLTAFTIAASLRIVGILLVSSLMVIPVAASLQLKQGFRRTVWLAIGLSVTSVVIGLIAAFYLDWAPGGTVVMTAVLGLLAIIMVQRIKRRRRPVT